MNQRIITLSASSSALTMHYMQRNEAERNRVGNLGQHTTWGPLTFCVGYKDRFSHFKIKHGLLEFKSPCSLCELLGRSCLLRVGGLRSLKARAAHYFVLR